MATTVPRKASTSGRVTPAKRKPKTTYDIDSEMLEEFGEEEDVATVVFGPIYGEEYLLLKEMNFFAVSGLGDIENDSAALQRYMLSMVHPDDRKRFQSAMASRIALNIDRLLFIMKRMTEAVADGNPTNGSSGSNRSARRAGGKALSAGS